MCVQSILKELKYATFKNPTATSVFDVLVTFLLEMSCRLLGACDEMRKRRFINKIKVKTSKSMEKANCEVNVGAMWKRPNFVYVWLSDVDLIMCNKNEVIAYLGAISCFVKIGERNAKVHKNE